MTYMWSSFPMFCLAGKQLASTAAFYTELFRNHQDRPLHREVVQPSPFFHTCAMKSARRDSKFLTSLNAARDIAPINKPNPTKKHLQQGAALSSATHRTPTQAR
eukprot:748221-Hanusia_phi.AAC.1